MTIAAQLGRVNSRMENAARSREFAEYAVALMKAQGNPEIALREAEANGASQRAFLGIPGKQKLARLFFAFGEDFQAHAGAGF